jgi:hypothetical protein
VLPRPLENHVVNHCGRIYDPLQNNASIPLFHQSGKAYGTHGLERCGCVEIRTINIIVTNFHCSNEITQRQPIID